MISLLSLGTFLQGPVACCHVVFFSFLLLQVSDVIWIGALQLWFVSITSTPSPRLSGVLHIGVCVVFLLIMFIDSLYFLKIGFKILHRPIVIIVSDDMIQAAECNNI